jgi:hypothetical protein
MITSLSEEVGKTYKKFNKTPLDLAYNQLNDFIDVIFMQFRKWTTK